MNNLKIVVNQVFFSKHLSYQILFGFVLMVLAALQNS